jgi:SAM-dependent methyltransferase
MTYGDYILETGGRLANLEEAKGRYLYHAYFRGLGPILDIGPGRCWFTRQDPDNIVALDTEPQLVAHFAAQGLKTRLGSIYDMPFEEETFGGVFCSFLFEHLHEPQRAIREIGRVLRPGGYVYLLVPSPRTLLTTFYDDFTHVRPFTTNALLELAREGGLRRACVEHLFWTRGTGKFSRIAGVDRTSQLLRLLDKAGRRVGVVNRNQLVLHAWK